jgi:[acyl-carrier-protein] S-malonyltransferase
LSNTAFLFPGQGAQTVGMGQALYDALPEARTLYDTAGEILGYDLASLCFDGPQEKLDSTLISQPALFVTSLAVLASLRVEQPEVVEACGGAAGLSLGEYTALVFAGVLTFEDGLRVVQQRGEAMQQAADATPSGMVSVLGLEKNQVQELCTQAAAGDVLTIANYLCPGNIVISGDKAACERALPIALELGAMKAIPLAVAGAFHTPIMESAVARLTEALETVSFAPPRIPVVLNVDGQFHDDPSMIQNLLARQVVEPVLWEASMRALLERGATEFYEVGPGRVLRGLLRRIERKITCHSLA